MLDAAAGVLNADCDALAFGAGDDLELAGRLVQHERAGCFW